MKIVTGHSVQNAFPAFCEMLGEVPEVTVLFPDRGFRSFVDVVKAHEPDIVMTMDSMIPSAMLALPQLDDECLPIHKRVVVTADYNSALLVVAAQTGFDDVVDVSRSIGVVIAQLGDLIEGKRSLRSNPIWQLLDCPSDLSRTEIILADEVDRQIVGLVAVGLSDREIADLVYLSCQTVRNRVSRLLDRCGVRNRTQLALLYTRAEYERVVRHSHATDRYVCRFDRASVEAV
jgi:DNA-binding NarL/FixJ family response regulator